MGKEFDCDYTENIICPYCGHEDNDDDNIFGREEDIEWECGDCGKNFSAHRDISITYSTQKRDWTGKKVFVRKDDGSIIETTAKSEPFTHGGREVIFLDGIAGFYLFSRVKLLENK